jgi:hypothetical protein
VVASLFSLKEPKTMSTRWIALFGWLGLLAANAGAEEREDAIRSSYSKTEVRIPMRDGVELFTSIYTPNNLDAKAVYPILMMRTPYGVGPYGPDRYRNRLAPAESMEKEGYIFVFQDVRGKMMSQGVFENMRPHLEAKQAGQIDESSDTFDTIDWLVRHVPRNNGRVGMWGISYPGFYTAAGAIDSHPALKAISPQAPIADWFFDDFHRNGAFVLPMAFQFFSSFGKSRPEPSVQSPQGLPQTTRDGYQFFLDLGPLSNVDRKYFQESIDFWNAMEAHPNYDDFWKARNILPHLKNIRCASLVVGGWYDTEDLYGPLAIYDAIEKANPGIANHLVMGPWYHGQWSRDEGKKLGEADFGFATSTWYQEQVIAPFFSQHLKEQAVSVAIPEATVFETGANRWRRMDRWPPQQVERQEWFFGAGGAMVREAPSESQSAAAQDRFVSDPAKPVPYTMEITTRWARDYVTEDQRFAAWRPDVLVYRSDAAEKAWTIAGPIEVDLWVASTQSDADWIVKLIDEYPGAPQDGTGEPGKIPETYPSGRQELVRAGVLRGRFREGFERAVPMVPGEPTRVRFALSDVLHTVRPGHRMMIQVQSTWFPFIDRNPQKFVSSIFQAKEEDFVPATHSLLRSASHASKISLPVLQDSAGGW